MLSEKRSQLPCSGSFSPYYCEHSDCSRRATRWVRTSCWNPSRTVWAIPELPSSSHRGWSRNTHVHRDWSPQAKRRTVLWGLPQPQFWFGCSFDTLQKIGMKQGISPDSLESISEKHLKDIERERSQELIINNSTYTVALLRSTLVSDFSVWKSIAFVKLIMLIFF